MEQTEKQFQEAVLELAGASHSSRVKVTLDDLPLVLTVEETAELLRIGRTACYEAIRSGAIPSIKMGGRSIRVSRHRLIELLGLSDNDL